MREGTTDADSDADTVPEVDTDTDADTDGATEADSVTVAFVVAEVEIVALLRISPEEPVEVFDSKAGMEDGLLKDSVAEIIELDDAPVPVATEVDEGMTLEETSVPESVKVGKLPEDKEREALPEIEALSVPVGRGVERLTEPDTVAEGRIPDDRSPDEN